MEGRRQIDGTISKEKEDSCESQETRILPVKGQDFLRRLEDNRQHQRNLPATVDNPPMQIPRVSEFPQHSLCSQSCHSPDLPDLIPFTFRLPCSHCASFSRSGDDSSCSDSHSSLGFCSQSYSLRQLLVFDPLTKVFDVDYFDIPSSCSCLPRFAIKLW